MYEYLDRKPEAGDIVECQTEDINSFSKNKLYICKKLEDTMLFTKLDDKGSTTNGVHPKHFKVVKTLHGDQAKVGDTCIRIANGVDNKYKGSKVGDVFKVIKIDRSNDVYYSNIASTDTKNIKVLRLANDKPKAYYKRSGKPWTAEELQTIPNIWNPQIKLDNTAYKWLYPTNSGRHEYYLWESQKPARYPQDYNLVAFEDEFPDIETLPITIPIGSYWQEMYTSLTSKKPIVEVLKLGTETVHFKDLGTDQSRSKLLRDFLNKFVPIPKSDSVSYDVDSRFELPKGYADIQPNKTIHQINDELGAPSEPTPTTLKEPTMTFQQLIHSIFQEEIQTDYDKKPNYLVVIYNNEGTEIAQATANSVKQVEDKIQSTPKLWGAKAIIYSIDSEVQTAVPVTTTKLKKAK